MAKKVVVKSKDNLSTAFYAYKNLINIEYEIIVKNGGNVESVAERNGFANTSGELEKEILLRFAKEDFYHLTGIRHSEVTKLIEYDRNGKTQSDFYNDVKLQKVTIADIHKSPQKDYLLKRLEIVKNIEQILDTTLNLTDYDGKLYYVDSQTKATKSKNSVKSAHCFVYNNNNSINFSEAKNIFLFFSLNEVKLFPSVKPRFLTFCCNPCSVIFKENLDAENYNYKHTKLIVLLRKKDCNNASVKTLYIAPGYIINKPNLLKKEIEYYKEDKTRLEELLSHPKITPEFKTEIQVLLNI